MENMEILNLHRSNTKLNSQDRIIDGLGLVWFMVFNATFKKFSVIQWWSVLLVEETGVPGENHRPVASH